MPVIFDTTDCDGDSLAVEQFADNGDGLVAGVIVRNRSETDAAVFLTRESLAGLRTALAQLALSDAAEDEPDEPTEDEDARYQDGYADGYAAGVLDSAELPKPLSHEQAMEKAIELVRRAQAHSLLTGRATVEQLLGVAMYLRGDLPVPPAQ